MDISGTDGKIRFAEKKEKEIRIIITGDLCPRGIAEEMLAAGKQQEFFGNLMRELHDKDLSITNFEATMSVKGEPIVKIGPNLNVTPDIMQGLDEASFDVYSLANNHTRDFGNDAFMDTIANIEKYSGKTVGGGKNLKDAEKALRVTVKGIRISIIAASMHNICCAEKNSPGAAPLRPGAVTLKIVEEKKISDIVIVIPHDGKEHVPFPSNRIRDNYRTFIDAGATAVIAHHPHIYGGMEKYNGGIIAYSLGNFLFPSRTPETAPEFWHKSYFLRLHCDSQGIRGLDIVPHKVSLEKSRMSIMESIERKEFLSKISRLSEIAANEELSSDYYDAASQKFAHYVNRIKEFLRLKESGGTNSDEYIKSAAYMNHMLTTEEHWDVVESLSRTEMNGKKINIPEDLEFLMK